ncbi:hypothetical protein [Catenovulum maritimum]|uniref:Lipoprotein n=1 Tax=Catenovulum maritimum TaxID=1513271 RepID=A0A0J8GZI8_9ALTE|nr:hypothetical protein [Catenovulum maritimum]KMT66649.1 hypothetical protein XM47_00490 [Catenovulum maritimum]
MKHKFIASLSLLASVLLTGCQTTQTPYEVNSSTNYKKGKSFNSYHLGVTEEKVNDRIYHVAVKLTGTSSAERAKDMFYLHAANLAMSKNFEKFSIEKRKTGRWCYGTKTRYSGQRSTQEAGPKYSGFVLLINDGKETVKKQKIYVAKNVKDIAQPKVEAIIDETSLIKNQERYLNACDGN